MAFKQIKNSYNAGELSEYMAGRTDINKYHNGASKFINATVLPHGGFVKRSGTIFQGKAPNKANLIPFEFSVDDSLILEFSNLLIRFYKNQDRVYEGDIEIASTTAADPVLVTTDAAHSLADDEWVFIEDVDGTTGLNDKIYQITVTGAGGATKFTLQDTEGNDINGTGFGVGGALGSCKRVYQIVSPYTSAESFEIHYTQSADVMYIAHEDHHPQKLSRVSDLSWTIADVGFTGGPFLEENTTAASLMTFTRSGGTARSGYYFPAGATGTLTATGGHTPFLGTANDVGGLWLIKHTRPDNTTSTQDNDTNAAPTDLTKAVRTKGDYTFDISVFVAGTDSGKLWRKVGDGEWQAFRPFTSATSFSATEDEADVYYAFSFSVNTMKGTFTAKDQVNRGIVKVTAESSTTVAAVIVIDPVLSNNSSDTGVATPLWAEGAFSLRRGYPRTVAFFEDRLWWSSTTNNPDTKWSSKTRLYENMNFSDLGLDNEAITAPLNDSEVSQIQWMYPRQVMAVGTANKEYRFGAANIDDPVTPSDRKATPQTSFGSDTIQPVVLNNAVFFFQRQGRKLRAMMFDAISQNFEAVDVTLLANTLFESAPTRMAVQRIPDSIIWVVRTDGVLLSFTYEPDEEVAGWARHLTANGGGVETPFGFFESVAVIHGTIEDEVWVSVKRVIDSVTVRYVERFATRFFDQVDEALMQDSAVVVSSAFDAQNIVLASDTVRCGEGLCDSSLCGGVPF